MPRPTAEQLRSIKETSRGRKEHHSDQWGGARSGAGRKPIGGTPKVTKSFSLSPEAVAKLEKAAQLGDCSMSDVIENLLNHSLKQL
jgi:hypothetical protein